MVREGRMIRKEASDDVTSAVSRWSKAVSILKKIKLYPLICYIFFFV